MLTWNLFQFEEIRFIEVDFFLHSRSQDIVSRLILIGRFNKTDLILIV